MRGVILLPILPVLMLAACDAHRNGGDDGKGGTHIALTGSDNGGRTTHVSIETPDFGGSIRLPGLDVGAHMDLDGIKLAPGTKVGRIDVTGDDHAGGKDHGTVRVTFTNPDAPDRLVDYYRTSATDGGWTVGTTTGTSLAAAKADKSFAMAASPMSGGGSAGTIDIGGGK